MHVEYLAARLRGDGSSALKTLRKAAILAPNSTASHNLALQAMAMNRPYESLRALEGEDPNAVSVSNWPPYWIYLAHANHLVGLHEAELRAVTELRRRYPERSVGLVLQAAALAALNRTEAIDSLFAADASSPNTYWSTGAALVTVGEELVAHGHPERSGPYYERAIAWLETRLQNDPANRYHREWLATTLYSEGRWEEARPVADSPGSRVPHPAAVPGHVGPARRAAGGHRGRYQDARTAPSPGSGLTSRGTSEDRGDSGRRGPSRSASDRGPRSRLCGVPVGPHGLA
jgi:tetratricopeptide (TPR) repeat protein